MRLIFASNSSTSSPSGFSKGNLDLYKEKCFGDKNQSSIICTTTVMMAQWENRELLTDLRVAGSKPLGVDQFFSKANLDDILSISTLTVWSSPQALHQSFRAQIGVLLLPPPPHPRLRPHGDTNGRLRKR